MGPSSNSFSHTKFKHVRSVSESSSSIDLVFMFSTSPRLLEESQVTLQCQFNCFMNIFFNATDKNLLKDLVNKHITVVICKRTDHKSIEGKAIA